MITKDLKSTKGITLISLVVSIIVMLILAGVSIVTLTGDNGLLNRTTTAKQKTEEAGIMENIKLAFQSAKIGEYVGESGSLADKIKKEIETIYGTGTVEEIKEENGVYTVTITGYGTYTIDANGNVARLESLNISPTPLNLQIREGETPTPTTVTATKYGIEEIVSWSISPAGVATISPETGDEIHVTPVAGGSATLTATCGGKTKECTVTVTEVNKVAVTFNLGGGSVNSSEAAIVINEFPGETITLPVPTAPAAPSETSIYTLKGWYDVAEDGNLVYAVNDTNPKVPNSATTVYAQWKETKLAFRKYGTARNTGTYGDSYSIGAITVNGEPIADNWKEFYEDDDFIYVIYGDYYPAAAQTEITTGNAIFAPAHKDNNNNESSDSSYAWSVNSRTDRTTLLGYLRNNNAYSWDPANQVDSYGTNGVTYASWDNLKTAIVTATGKTAADITIQGSPDIDLWVKSWNAKYSSSANLKASKETYGYNIMLDTEDSNSLYYINVILQSLYNGANNFENGTGYYDELYFPYRGNTTSDGTNAEKAFGYWLASPGARGTACGVTCNGYVGCDCDYYYDYLSVRPVIAIAK